ncbi:hypothetical protein BCR32DRAFT_245557 [Anaeromyces robustus]|jgi:hypothetical protein|uniref:Uncharacterized protein n=1 Tax=Anaeromyces robustus TaxID=1754192 RepID=A0A1Y1X416_9FUNG|nr:hypothetical protein BCR32DRAFT_245557 [Anaeromyces robustus]|eukprot:ORX80551.1 hypothetical protein BCR32DRAFT_245557 [Anaeromyces robustus]
MKSKTSSQSFLRAIIVIFVVEVLVLIYRSFTYLSKYRCYNFSLYLQDDQPTNIFDTYRNMTKKSYSALRKIKHDFPTYSDSAGIGFFFDQSISIGEAIICIFLLSCFVYFCYNRKGCCSSFFYIIAPIICLCSSIGTIIQNINIVPQEDIDKEILDDYLKNYLNKLYYGKKKKLIICAITVIVSIIVQIVLLIMHIRSNSRNDNNKPDTVKEFVSPTEDNNNDYKVLV